MNFSPFFHASRHCGGVIRLRLLIGMLCVSSFLLGTVALAWYWLHQPMTMRSETIHLNVSLGTSPYGLAQQCVDEGFQTSPWLLYQWFRWSGQSKKIKSGQYLFKQEISPRELLARLTAGQKTFARAQLIDGWTFTKWRHELAKLPGLLPSSKNMTDAQLMAALGAEILVPEGQFLPDTYHFSPGSKDLNVMRLAYKAMQEKIDSTWVAFQQLDSAKRCPVQDKYQFLTLASIVEKETGDPRDRASVAAVFCNRLRLGMRLQTDPTVIYGMGSAFDGNLRKVHLQTDTPYNTYTRVGLPPTPISMPSVASIAAVLQPADINALYFVARGDGSSVFSLHLKDHNRAVNQYQRKQSMRRTTQDTSVQ